MPKVEKMLFNDSELAALRRSFYAQAPATAALLLDESDNYDGAADETVELIEALIERIAEVPE